MPLTVAAGNDVPDSYVGRYQRRRPEQTLLYQIVEQYYPVFYAYLAEHDCMDAGGRATHGAVAEGGA